MYCLLRRFTSERAPELDFQQMDVLSLLCAPRILLIAYGSEFTTILKSHCTGNEHWNRLYPFIKTTNILKS